MGAADLEIVFGLCILLIGGTLGTSGAAALLTVWFPSWRRSLRVFIATVVVPTLIVGTILLFSIAEGGTNGDPLSEDLLMGGIVSIMFCMIGWPVAHFLTRALDRGRSEKWETFE